MSRVQNPLILSISKKRLETQIASNIEKIANERQSQTIITQSFNAKRNSGQIERYFIETQSSFRFCVIIIFSMLIIFGIIAALLLIPRIILKNKISNMTEKIVILTQNEIMCLVSFDLNLSFFYSELLSCMFSHPEIVIPDLYTAKDIVRVFVNAYLTNQNNKIWRLGLSDGRFVGFSAQNEIKLYYSRTNGDDIYPLYSWDGDPITYDNTSYPYIYYESGEPFISYDTYWYIAAENEKRNCWTLLSTLKSTDGKLFPIISTASPVFDSKNGAITQVFSIGVNIEKIQLFFNNFLTSKISRFALLNSFDVKGTIIACTGQDLPYEEINDMLSFKTLLELQDNIWHQVALNKKFENGDNFTFKHGSYFIHIINVPFEIAPGIIWRFLSIFSVSDIVDIDIQTVDSWSFVAILLFITVSILIAILLIILNKSIEHRQSKILKEKGKEDKEGRIKYAGIYPSIKLLKKILLSHADNLDINKSTRCVIDDLINSTKFAYFNSAQLIETIEDQKVKDKFVNIFGHAKSELIKSLQNTTKSDLDIIEYYKEKKETKVPALSHLRKAQNTFENKLEKIIISRHNMVVLKKDKIIKRVTFFVQSFNLINPLFDPEQLDIIVHKIICAVGDQTLPLLYDSIEFVFILMKRNAQLVIPNTDYSLAIIFSLFSYHISMINRVSRYSQLIDKFFQRKTSKISQDAHSILFGLYKILIDFDSNRLERWRKFKNIVFDLITNATVIYQHRVSFAKSNFILNIAEKTHSNLTINEVYCVSLSIFCAGQFSYFFHRKEDCHILMKIFVPSINQKPRPLSLSKFINCIIMQYFQPLLNTLGSLCGNDFIDWLRSAATEFPPENTRFIF